MNYFERSLAIQIYREIHTTTAEHLFMSLPGNGMTCTDISLKMLVTISIQN